MRMARVVWCGLVMSWGLVASGCGGDDDDGPNCGTLAEPVTLTLADVTPAQGSSVVNDSIVHAFTIVGVRALFSTSMRLLPAHSAGAPDPVLLNTTVDTSGEDLRYTVAPLRWTTAPASVRVDDSGRYETTDGCVYAFPSPLFSYDVTAAP